MGSKRGSLPPKEGDLTFMSYRYTERILVMISSTANKKKKQYNVQVKFSHVITIKQNLLQTVKKVSKTY